MWQHLLDKGEDDSEQKKKKKTDPVPELKDLSALRGRETLST